MIIQSVLINNKKYNFREALKKLMDRGFKYKKVDKTENYFRFRQIEPKKGNKYRIIEAGEGIKYIIIV